MRKILYLLHLFVAKKRLINTTVGLAIVVSQIKTLFSSEIIVWRYIPPIAEKGRNV
jgi:hypothetical protein